MSDVNGLDVYMHGVIAGLLERRSQAKLRFTYDEDWVAGEHPPLSLSLPVRSKPYEHEECAPFFEGLLPEGDFLKAIARTLHVSATNPFQLLTELGGECAGAISVAPTGGPEPGQDPRPPRWLSEGELGRLLVDLPTRPLIDAIDEVEDGGGFRLSLAGAQNKVGVLLEEDRIGLSYGKPPTTGILKAPIPHVTESVANEAFCMSLAGHIDLEVAAASPHVADSQEYLLVRRYDRSRDLPDGRIHQEDFCQALGLVPAVKYEKEGGPNISDCAELIRRHCSAPARDITAFLDALLFNFAIANYDAHSKNYSLLLDGPGSIRLAPLYDLISTVVFQGTDRKLAMRYGGENRPAYLRGRHFDRLAAELEVKPSLVRRRAIAMRERTEAAVEEARRSLPEEFQDRPILDKVIEVVIERGETMTQRADEISDSVSEAPVEEARKRLKEGDHAAKALGDALLGLRGALELSGGVFNAATNDFGALTEQDVGAELALERVEQFAGELETPAQEIKQYGRQIYDEVVEFDSAFERIRRILDEVGGRDSTDAEMLEMLGRMADAIDANISDLEGLYAAISPMELASPKLRAPVRNMRAGLHDILDAKKIVSGWRQRASALDSAEEVEAGESTSN
jgi:serine/threonine-protein kinase HipA